MLCSPCDAMWCDAIANVDQILFLTANTAQRTHISRCCRGVSMHSFITLCRYLWLVFTWLNFSCWCWFLVVLLFLSFSVTVFRVQIPECRLRKAFATREWTNNNDTHTTAAESLNDFVVFISCSLTTSCYTITYTFSHLNLSPFSLCNAHKKTPRKAIKLSDSINLYEIRVKPVPMFSWWLLVIFSRHDIYMVGQ